MVRNRLTHLHDRREAACVKPLRALTQAPLTPQPTPHPRSYLYPACALLNLPPITPPPGHLT
jgi:hypothetical protein